MLDPKPEKTENTKETEFITECQQLSLSTVCESTIKEQERSNTVSLPNSSSKIDGGTVTTTELNNKGQSNGNTNEGSIDTKDLFGRQTGCVSTSEGDLC